MKKSSILLCSVIFIFSSNALAGPASTLMKTIYKAKSAVKGLPTVSNGTVPASAQAAREYLHFCNKNQDKNSNLCLTGKNTPATTSNKPNSFTLNNNEAAKQKPTSNIFINSSDKDNITDKNILDFSKVAR